MIKAESAFLVIKHEDGNFTATADLSLELEVERDADERDITTGIRDLNRVIDRNDLVKALTEALKGKKTEEEVQGSIRKALDERGIL